MKKVKNLSSRILTLDLLRGYFIFIIIVDHLIRWPSLFAWLTGQGRLWVSAAEGFFIISGLLIGYTRGFKMRQESMIQVTKALYRRAFILYLSSVIVTLLLYLIASNLMYPAALQPTLPPEGTSFFEILKQIVTQKFVFEWIYFLKLYWAALLLAPPFIGLFRKKKFVHAVFLSLVLWGVGIIIDYDWLQWQVLLFVPALVGYNLEPLRAKWQVLTEKRRKLIRKTVIGAGLVTLALSSFWVFGWVVVENPHTRVSFDSYVTTRTWLDPIFAKSPLSPARVGLSFVWFSTLFFMVRLYEQKIIKTFGWLFLQFGERSLSAYILHSFVLVFFQAFIIGPGSFENALITTAAVLLTATLLRVPLLNRILPR